MWKALITVTLRASILDPQGSAVVGALKNMGYGQVKQVRVGKYLEVTVEANNRGAAEHQIKEMCDRLLVNPVIEEYRFDLVEV